LLNKPRIKSFLRHGGDLGDGPADVPPLTDSGTTAPEGIASLFYTNSMLDLVETGAAVLGAGTLADGAHDFSVTATNSAGSGSAAQASAVSTEESAAPLTIADGATVEIGGASAQSVAFEGTTGTLVLDDPLAFKGRVSGLAGSDALDLSDVSYGANTQVTFLGNTTGGTLTITYGTQTANITLEGDYLSSYWTVSSDGNGGTTVVDPVASNSWQRLDVGAGGYIDGIDIAPMVPISGTGLNGSSS
jgi:hypothetical protein